MDLFGLKKKREQKHLDFMSSLSEKDSKYLYDAYCALDMDRITGNTNKFTEIQIRAVVDELEKRGFVNEFGQVYPYKVDEPSSKVRFNSLEEWNISDLGVIDNIQFNGYEVFITGENKIVRIYGEEDDCAETSVKLGFVDEVLEREELQYIEMNTELEDIDVCTLNATLKFKDDSILEFEFIQIMDDDDYSLDNLKLKANYSYNRKYV